MRCLSSWWAASTLAVFAAGCSGRPTVLDGGDGGDVAVDAMADVMVPVDVSIPADRAVGVHAQAPGACDTATNLRCLLPWPSNRHVVADATRVTGLHVQITDPIPGHGDSATPLEHDDGFSRLSAVIAGFPVALDDAMPPARGADGPMILVATEGPGLGQRVSLRYEIFYNHQLVNPQAELIAYPAVPLAAATEYVVAITDALHSADGMPIAPSHDALVALNLTRPTTQDDGNAVAYYAPDRAALTAAHVDSAHVIRMWSFTTRSTDDPLASIRAVRTGVLAAIDAGHVAVAIDTVTTPALAGAAMIVEGRLTGLPSYTGADGQLLRDASGMPTSMGVHDAPFRILVPSVTTSTYPIAMWGHGLGGNFHDDSFDAQFASNGNAKVGLQFNGFTDTTTVDTFGSLSHAILGTGSATAGIVQAIGDGTGIQHALATILGDTLSAPMIGGMVNPAAGHRPDVMHPMWTGGSLGGTLGLVYTCAEPSIVAALLNVPGAGWTRFVPPSIVFAGVRAIVRSNYPSDIDLRLAIAMSQNSWDQIDGGAWVDTLDAAHRPLILLQESIGDPVLPNIGSEFMAASLHAVQLGAVLAPVEGVLPGTSPTMQTTLTQYRVPASVTGNYAIHGFGAGDSIAGQAAREQFSAFLLSVRAGAGQITLPDLCVNNTPASSCDFSSH